MFHKTNLTGLVGLVLYACSAAHADDQVLFPAHPSKLHEARLLQIPKSIGDKPPSVSERNFLLEHVINRGNQCSAPAVAVAGQYGIDIQANPVGGLRRSAAYAGQLYLGLKCDLQRLFRTKNGLHLYASLTYNTGKNLSDYIGNIFPVAGLWGGATVRLDELYVKHSPASSSHTIKLGRLGGGWDFAFLDALMFYISDAIFGNLGAILVNTPLPVDPVSNWGMFLSQNVLENVSMKMGLYQGNRLSWENRYHGVNFTFECPDGALLISEIESTDLVKRSHCLLGMYYVLGHNHGNYGMYFMWENDITLGESIKVTPWFIGLVGPGSRNPISWSIGAGFTAKGLFRCRRNDLLCLGFAYSRLNPDSRPSVFPGSFEGNESLIELNYWIQLFPWIMLTPVLQWIGTPRNMQQPKDALVIGIQVKLNL